MRHKILHGGSVPESFILHSETELPGEDLPIDTHEIISCRYQFAARLASGKRVLEIGSGPGIGMGLLSNHASSLVGVEYSEENIRAARKYYGKKQNFVRADAHVLPFADASFDLVVALAMVYYLDIDRFLVESKRILGRDGVLFFCMSNKNVPGFVSAPHTTNYYSVPELSAKLAGHGMTADLQGAFPVSGNLPRRQIRAAVKNIAKAMVQCVPGGRGLWLKLRESTLGTHAILPHEISEEPSYLGKVSVIEPDALDRSHRVLYVIARAQSHAG